MKLLIVSDGQLKSLLFNDIFRSNSISRLMGRELEIEFEYKVETSVHRNCGVSNDVAAFTSITANQLIDI